MAFRTRYRSVDPVPAPNSYTLPNLFGSHVPHKSSSASFTMSARRKAGGPSEDLSMTPGPCRYNSTEPSVYLNRQPSFSMQSRHNNAIDTMRTPGPGTHSPEKVTAHLPRAPSFSLGVRHSEFVTPLIVDVLD
ncbi:outer dense fiber protein 3-like protein [Pimephales promelas]|nr:outer dense fiber protein 3-like protein [Pimephales promelas]